jgi:hypothetical protein
VNWSYEFDTVFVETATNTSIDISVYQPKKDRRATVFPRIRAVIIW